MALFFFFWPFVRFPYVSVEPPFSGAYSILYCLAKSSNSLNVSPFANAPRGIMSSLNCLFHSRNCQKGSQIGRVRGDDDEAEKPPSGRHQTTRNIFWRFAAPLGGQRSHTKPKAFLKGGGSGQIRMANAHFKCEVALLLVLGVPFAVVSVRVGTEPVEHPKQSAGEQISPWGTNSWKMPKNEPKMHIQTGHSSTFWWELNIKKEERINKSL